MKRMQKRMIVQRVYAMFAGVCLSSTIVSAAMSDHFVTTRKTDHTGVSNDSSITIPVHPDYEYNYSVDRDNDGTMDQTGITGAVTYDFGTPGTYTIRITGTYPAIYLGPDSKKSIAGDSGKIIRVDQWGTNKRQTMEKAFQSAINLDGDASDVPDLSHVESMELIFGRAETFNGDISKWDVSNVRSMKGAFAFTNKFNGDVSKWDVSNVEDISYMFAATKAFNNDISGRKTDKVTDMEMMFAEAQGFTHSIGSLNIQHVTKMKRIFALDKEDSFFPKESYDKTLQGRAAQENIPRKINLGKVSAYYCNAGDARAKLINEYGWEIDDKGLDISCVNRTGDTDKKQTTTPSQPVTSTTPQPNQPAQTQTGSTTPPPVAQTGSTTKPTTGSSSDLLLEKLLGGLGGTGYVASDNLAQCDALVIEDARAFCYAKHYQLGHLIEDPKKISMENLIANNAREPVTRQIFAQMTVNFYYNALGKKRLTDAQIPQSCKQYQDNHLIQAGSYRYFVEHACALGLMGVQSDGVTPLAQFMPYQPVTRAQFATVISRMLWGTTYNTSSPTDPQRADGHLRAMKRNGYINYIDGNRPQQIEKKAYGWIILMRIAQKKNAGQAL